MQYAIALSHELLGSLVNVFGRLPAPATGALLIVAVVCLYEWLGNSSLTPGKWR